MRNATYTVADFLATKPRQAVWPMCYTFTLIGGTVYRWTDAEIPITVPGGYTFTPGPRTLDDMGIKSSRGFTVDDAQIQIGDDGSCIVSGVPILQFIGNNGFNMASVLIEQACGPSWTDILGSFILFSGRYAELKDWGETQCTLTINSWLDVLNEQSVNQNVITSQCRHAFGDAGCTINLASYTSSATVQANSENSTLIFKTNCSLAAGRATLGTITFTSGANNGLSRTIKLQDGSGNISLILPLSATPAAGDTCTITQGCDLSSATCLASFNNLLNFGGFPNVPPPELGY